MWPFKKRRKPEGIVDALRRLGATAKVYCKQEGKEPPPDDGKVYGQYTLSKDGVIMRFYIDHENPRALVAIKAITEDEYFGKAKPEYRLMPYSGYDDPVYKYETVKHDFKFEPIVKCTPETHPSCGYVEDYHRDEHVKVFKACLDCGRMVTHPDHDHCDKCVRES